MHEMTSQWTSCPNTLLEPPGSSGSSARQWHCGGHWTCWPITNTNPSDLTALGWTDGPSWGHKGVFTLGYQTLMAYLLSKSEKNKEIRWGKRKSKCLLPKSGWKKNLANKGDHVAKIKATPYLQENRELKQKWKIAYKSNLETRGGNLKHDHSITDFTCWQPASARGY